MLANVLWTDFPFAVKLSDSIDQEWWLSYFKSSHYVCKVCFFTI